MKIKIAGVRRGSQYSPNHVGNDAAIFNLTVQHLQKLGCEVIEYSEDEFADSPVEEDIIFNMARDVRSIRKLQELEDGGKMVVNSGYGIENCTREKMTRLLLADHIPHPHSLIIPTDQPLPLISQTLGENCWIKRGDFHAIHREDVTYVRNQEEAESVLHEYALRGIPTAVLNEHLKGDLVKFYGIAGTDFFHWFYPDDLNHTKFGLESINGKANGIPFDLESLKDICNRAARVLNIYIYGGDCVVDASGTLRIIDFNDWPSFAPCRSEAAASIARCIYDRILEWQKKSKLTVHHDDRSK